MPRVLIVDDDPEYNASIKEFVESEGYNVTSCTNGRDALNMQKESPFDIIITDIIMPNVDGLEIIYQIRNNYPLTRIIAISGGGIFHTMDLLLMAKELGASMVLSKPFSPHLLKVQLLAMKSTMPNRAEQLH